MRNLPHGLLLLTGLLGPLATAACAGSDSITTTITPSATDAVNDGQTATNINVVVTAEGAPAPDGTVVTFTVPGSTSASFTPTVSGTPPNQTTMAATPSTTATTTAGQAQVQLYDTATETVNVTISADATLASGVDDMIIGSPFPDGGEVTVQFGAKCVGGITTSSASGTPSQIVLSCESDYMGGIFPWDQTTSETFAGDTQSCSALVSNTNGQTISNAPVQFLTEAGAFETGVVTSGENPTVLTDDTGTANVDYEATLPYPEDVTPNNRDGTLLTKPSGTATQQRAWTGSDASGNPHTYNPRDGWVTMIAATPGTPGLTGSCTSTSCPEPYVDSNDNGMYDLGEPFIDVNCDGSWDAQQTPNAQGLVMIWNTKTIVWTDGVWEAASCAGETGCTGTGFQGFNPSTCGTTIKGGAKTCNATFRFVDKNLNLLSTFLTSDDNAIAYSISTDGSLEATPTSVAIDQGLLTQSLVQSPDFVVSLNDIATAGGTAVPYTLSAQGTFVFCDDNLNASLVCEQTFSPSTTGSCD